MRSTIVYLFIRRVVLVTLVVASFLDSVRGLAILHYPTNVEVGQTYVVEYKPADVTVTFVLRHGNPDHLDTIGALDGFGTGGIYHWTVDSGVPTGTQYALQIKDDSGEINYSGNYITVTGSKAAAPSSSSSAASLTKPSSAAPPSSAPPSSAAPSNTPSTPSTTQAQSNAPSSSTVHATSAVTSSQGTASPSVESATSAGLSAGGRASTSSAGSTISVTQGASQPSTSSTTIQINSQGLNKRTKIGIGVGAAIGSFILALVAFFLGASARRKSSVKHDQEANYNVANPEMDGKEINGLHQTPEIDGQEGRPQAPVPDGMAEIGGQSIRAESRTELDVPQPPPIRSPTAELGNDVNRTELPGHPSGPSPQELPVNNDTPAPPQGPVVAHEVAKEQNDLLNDPRLTRNPWAS